MVLLPDPTINLGSKLGNVSTLTQCPTEGPLVQWYHIIMSNIIRYGQNYFLFLFLTNISSFWAMYIFSNIMFVYRLENKLPAKFPFGWPQNNSDPDSLTYLFVTLFTKPIHKQVPFLIKTKYWFFFISTQESFCCIDINNQWLDGIHIDLF